MTEESAVSSTYVFLNDRWYAVTKYFVQIVLPATATLYFALSELWGLPRAAEVVGTITALSTFLGVVLMLNSRAYYKSDKPYDGKLVISNQVREDEESGEVREVKQYNLDLHVPPEKLDSKNSVVFKVQ